VKELAIAHAESDRASVYLHPGQLFVTSEPCEIISVLGSCVSVCIHDRSRGIGGANHYLLPSEGTPPSARYGSFAISALVARLLQAGAEQRDLVAKVFGGATLIGAKVGSVALGECNVRMARMVLAKSNIPIVAEDVGGLRGRRVMFRPDDGAAIVKRL
jgi:chemotaxis protein CheD